MSKQIVAIVGYTNWGKSHTLYELFQRRQFFPLKSPIASKLFGGYKFTVINASNEDRQTKKYLERFKQVLEKHNESGSIFFITISLIFNNGSHDVSPVFDFLNKLPNTKVDYMLLENGWSAGKTLATSDIGLMYHAVGAKTIHRFSDIIDQSKPAFSERTFRIADKVSNLIADL